MLAPAPFCPRADSCLRTIASGARGFRGFVRAFGGAVRANSLLGGGWQLSSCPEIASARTIEIVLSAARDMQRSRFVADREIHADITRWVLSKTGVAVGGNTSQANGQRLSAIGFRPSATPFFEGREESRASSRSLPSGPRLSTLDPRPFRSFLPQRLARFLQESLARRDGQQIGD